MHRVNTLPLSAERVRLMSEIHGGQSLRTLGVGSSSLECPDFRRLAKEAQCLLATHAPALAS